MSKEFGEILLCYYLKVFRRRSPGLAPGFRDVLWFSTVVTRQDQLANHTN